MIIMIKRSKIYDKINKITATAQNQSKQKRDNYLSLIFFSNAYIKAFATLRFTVQIFKLRIRFRNTRHLITDFSFVL